jgi:hypothetical protein
MVYRDECGLYTPTARELRTKRSLSVSIQFKVGFPPDHYREYPFTEFCHAFFVHVGIDSLCAFASNSSAASRVCWDCVSKSEILSRLSASHCGLLSVGGREIDPRIAPLTIGWFAGIVDVFFAELNRLW